MTKIEQALQVKQSAPKMKLYRRLWKYLLNRQTLLFAGYALLVVALSALTPVYTLLWEKYIDGASAGQEVKILIGLLLSYLALRMLVDFGSFLAVCFMDRINLDSWRELDGAINEKAVNIKYEYFEAPILQVLVNRAWNFSHGAYVDLYQLSLEILRSVILTAGILVSLFLVDPVIFFATLAVVLLEMFLSFFADRNQTKKEEYVSEHAPKRDYFKGAKYHQGLIKDMICGSAFHFFNRKYSQKADEIYQQEIQYDRKDLLFHIIGEVVCALIITASVIYAAQRMIAGQMTIGEISVVLMLITTAAYDAEDLVKNFVAVYTRTADIAHFFNFMDLEAEKGAEQGSEDMKACADDAEIQLKHVSYRYPFAAEEVLRDINLSVKKNRHIAIVGCNGSGKTTLVKLIMGLLEPTEGKVLTTNKQTEPHRFSAVYQDYCRYKDSLRQNIAVSDLSKEPDDDEIRRILERIGFHQEIAPDTMLSKEFGGVELSGGEWQRVAIARGIYRNADIMVLDEPTASIDPVAESELYKLFDEMTQDQTCFFVTHRLGSVLFSDWVLFMEDGKIVEQGTHQELLQKNGKYAAFWHQQAGQYGELAG